MDPQEPQSPQTQSRSNQTEFTVIGLIVGALTGYPLSYYFQSEALRAKLSLGEYIQNFSEIVGNSEFRSSVILGFVVAVGVCAVTGFVIGRVLDQRK